MVVLAALLVASATPTLAGSIGRSSYGLSGPGIRYSSPAFFALDTFVTAPTAAYSIRRLRTAYAGNKAFSVVRASDSTTTDVGFQGNGNPDSAALATFCAATTCKFITFYDQVGSRDLTQATDANRYTVQLAALGGVWPAAQATAGAQTHVSASAVTPATGLVSFSVIANRSVGTGGCGWMRENAGNNRFVTQAAVANGWTLIGGTSDQFSRTAADAAWHAGQAVMNGASSVINIDGAESTGTATGNTTAAAPGITGVAATTCNLAEMMFWDNRALTAAERAYLVNNQRVFGGF